MAALCGLAALAVLGAAAIVGSRATSQPITLDDGAPIAPGLALLIASAARPTSAQPLPPAALTHPPTAAAPVPAVPRPTPAPSPVATGRRVAVGGLIGAGCLNLRDTPSLAGRVLACLPAGSTLQVTGGPRDADGYHWWKVDAGGWAADQYLVDTVAVAPTPAVAASIAAANVTAPPSAALPRIVGGTLLYGYAGWATYYGIEDGFVRGDIMNDGTPYDPGDPTITAASFVLPLHTWLRVCTVLRCILVQVRDRGLLDQNNVLLDLSRAAYALLFGGLGGRQWISAYFAGTGTITPALPSLPAAAATAAP